MNYTGEACAALTIIGICAYEERGQGQGLGEEGGTYIVEWASALRRGGLATQMLREARKGWGRGRGRTELQVHTCNVRALRYYRGLGMRRCRWWAEMGGEGTRGRKVLVGNSLYEPRPGSSDDAGGGGRSRAGTTGT